MTHPEENTFHEYLDLALSDSEMETFEMHLETCEPCRRELEELEGLFMQIESIEDVVVARDLSPSIVENLSTPIFKNGVFWRGISVPLVVSALIVFAARAEILASIRGFSFPEFAFRPGEWILETVAETISIVDQFLSASLNSLTVFEVPVLAVELSIQYVIVIALGVAGLAVLIDLLYLRSMNIQKEM